MSDTPRTDAQCGCNYSRELERELAAAKAEVERLRGIVPEFLEKLNDELCAENERLRAEVEALRAALTDMYAGWKYIRSFHGDLYGVGWDRCDEKARAALAKEKAS